MKVLHRVNERRRVLNELSQLFEKAKNVFVIHYSCESFYDRTDGKTPRITSIAVRNLGSGQTESFSIHKIAEIKKIPVEDIGSAYDNLELEMLNEFFEFVKAHQGYTWCHWNMRDINYGFSAIEHRYRVLGGQPYHIEELSRFDVARALVDIYGVRYIGHPRLENLIEKNKITRRDFMSGEQEASAFSQSEYVKLHQSTLRKVDIIANILERIVEGDLKTNARLIDIYGLNPQNVGELLKDHWLFAILGVLAVLLTLFGYLFNLFGSLPKLFTHT